MATWVCVCVRAYACFGGKGCDYTELWCTLPPPTSDFVQREPFKVSLLSMFTSVVKGTSQEWEFLHLYFFIKV